MERDAPEEYDNIWFKSVEVEALYDRIDFEIHFNPDLNVIYGKNGRGKTTLLHILANLTELDFARFENLTFKRIVVSNNKDDKIEITKPDGNISVVANGSQTSVTGGETSLTQSEQDYLRTIIGERSTYLPAFRSVLESTKEYKYYHYEEFKHPQFDEIREHELEAVRRRRTATYTGRFSEEANESALKTIRCRSWFGKFVPIIRYPSISDVIRGLSEEWKNAQISMNRREQSLFEEAFLKIFAAIASGEIDSKASNQQDILERIQELLSSEDPGRIERPRASTYDQLVDLAGKVGETDTKYNSVLEIYREILEERKKAREAALRPLNEFQASVNKFLDQKKLKIGMRNVERPVRQRPSSSYVLVESDAGRPYHLTALSSGERQIATMLYSASRTKFHSGAFLIDEPELSLHIDWQRLILSEIQQQYPERQIIACTHSPEVGADHPSAIHHFEPRSTPPDIGDFDLDDLLGDEDL